MFEEVEPKREGRPSVESPIRARSEEPPITPVKPAVVYLLTSGDIEIRPPVGPPPKTPIASELRSLAATALRATKEGDVREGLGGRRRDLYTPGNRVWCRRRRSGGGSRLDGAGGSNYGRFEPGVTGLVVIDG